MSEKTNNTDHLYSIIEQTKDMIQSNDGWWVTKDEAQYE